MSPWLVSSVHFPFPLGSGADPEHTVFSQTDACILLWVIHCPWLEGPACWGRDQATPKNIPKGPLCKPSQKGSHRGKQQVSKQCCLFWGDF